MILEARNSEIKVLATSRSGKGSVPGAQPPACCVLGSLWWVNLTDWRPLRMSGGVNRDGKNHPAVGVAHLRVEVSEWKEAEPARSADLPGHR